MDRFIIGDVVFIYRKDHVRDAAFRYFLEQIKPQ